MGARSRAGTGACPYRLAERKIKAALAVLSMIFFIVAISISCARRPKPESARAPAPPVEAPAPLEEERAPLATAPTEPTSGQMGEERITRGEEGEVASVAELQDIHFDFDRYGIRPDARPILEKNGKRIKGLPGVKVQVEGHCDERGTVEYNLALGDRRARSTRDYLISLGVDPTQLSTISFGEERPLDPDHNEEAWAKNRRAHFVVLK